jgi:uncharacterized protein YecT (DUF1311 family)
MKKLVSVIVIASSFAVGTACAQIPVKSDTSEVVNGAANMATISAGTAAKIAVTSGAQAGSLNECYSAIGDQPQTALQSCLKDKRSKAMSRMNVAYQKLVARTKKIDSSATAKALTSLNASQKAFDGFKDAECQWKGDAVMGGSGAGDILISCEVDLMRWRAKQLAE